MLLVIVQYVLFLSYSCQSHYEDSPMKNITCMVMSRIIHQHFMQEKMKKGDIAKIKQACLWSGFVTVLQCLNRIFQGLSCYRFLNYFFLFSQVIVFSRQPFHFNINSMSYLQYLVDFKSTLKGNFFTQ